MTNRTLHEWLYQPTFEESVCWNPFHSTMEKVYQGYIPSILDPTCPDEGHIYTKVAKLLKVGLILLEGDVIYVREKDNLHPLNEAAQLLAYYMHTDTKEANKAAALLESNFQGYFPISDGLVWRDAITVNGIEEEPIHFSLKGGIDKVDTLKGIPEFGVSEVHEEHFLPLAQYFGLMNQAVGEDWFFEKALIYHFTQRIREKSFVLVGGGGNGKSLFMLMVQRLFGQKSYTDAPQPNFKGHDAAVISYNFIGKRMVTFNDVGNPSVAFLEWLKRMITGNLEVKTPSGAWMSVPCKTNFILESNHQPEILDIHAHRRRYVVREIDKAFQLTEEMSEHDLDIVGELGNITAGDLVFYLHQVSSQIDSWIDFADMTPKKKEVANVPAF